MNHAVISSIVCSYLTAFPPPPLQITALAACAAQSERLKVMEFSDHFDRVVGLTD